MGKIDKVPERINHTLILHSSQIQAEVLKLTYTHIQYYFEAMSKKKIGTIQTFFFLKLNDEVIGLLKHVKGKNCIIVY